MKAAIINMEETAGKTVGRRRAPNSIEAARKLQKSLNEQLKNAGHALSRKGVFRFNSHEEADQWMQQMIRPKKS